MIDLHNERSLRKESTLTGLNGTPDCDDASPRKKAPLLKLDGTPDRDGRSYLKKASPTKTHGAVLLLKSLVAFCLLGNVTAISAPTTTCGCSEAINEAVTALRVELQAEFQTKLDFVAHELQDVRECSGCASPSPPPPSPSPPPPSPSPPPPSPSPPPPSPSPPPPSPSGYTSGYGCRNQLSGSPVIQLPGSSAGDWGHVLPADASLSTAEQEASWESACQAFCSPDANCGFVALWSYFGVDAHAWCYIYDVNAEAAGVCHQAQQGGNAFKKTQLTIG